MWVENLRTCIHEINIKYVLADVLRSLHVINIRLSPATDAKATDTLNLASVNVRKASNNARYRVR
jgi:beta-xylosidase